MKWWRLVIMATVTEMAAYKNGNYHVFLDLETGTMVRYTPDDELKPQFPDSMDIKITNQCSKGCKWCHEKSTPCGEHGDIMSDSFIDRLHPYTQLAIGGGNVLEHPDFFPFLLKCKRLNLIPSITLNQEHFLENISLLEGLSEAKLVCGLGVSLTDTSDIVNLMDNLKKFPNAVVHVIAGVVSVSQLQLLSHQNFKLLILGYKNFGRGKSFLDGNLSLLVEKLQELRKYLPNMVKDKWFSNIAFDNLALGQLKVKEMLPPQEWERFYMGADGVSTMYVDMVKREFAKSSTSETRYSLKEDVQDMLKVIHKKRE